MTHEEDPAGRLMQYQPPVMPLYFLLTGSSGFQPRIGVRDKLFAGMMGGLAVSLSIQGVVKAN